MQSTSDVILRELARSGNPAAIATLLNQLFESHDVRVKASVKQDTLKVVLTSQSMTDKSIIIFLLMQAINPLIPLPFRQLKVHFHQTVKYFVNNKTLEKIRYNVWIYEQEMPQSVDHELKSSPLD